MFQDMFQGKKKKCPLFLRALKKHILFELYRLVIKLCKKYTLKPNNK